MTQAVADTHAVIWYLYSNTRLSPNARGVFEKAAEAGETIGVSSITLVEIVYLVEKGRIQADALQRMVTAMEDQDSVLVELPVDRSVVQAMQSIPWSVVPEMPDRIIAATALSINVPLVSRDGKIKLSEIETIW